VLERSEEFYNYCVQAFSRDGIPLFISKQYVSVLNGESDYYSDLFCDKAVQIRFAVRGGEFDVSTVNSSGGEETADQSDGELAVAGLIASFTLRAIAPKTNVLVLDEPGAGLDPATTRRFAAALLQLRRERISNIFLTTHNPILLAELGRETTVTVVKEKGVSTIQQ
jgi:predicted ATPase